MLILLVVALRGGGVIECSFEGCGLEGLGVTECSFVGCGLQGGGVIECSFAISTQQKQEDG